VNVNVKVNDGWWKAGGGKGRLRLAPSNPPPPIGPLTLPPTFAATSLRNGLGCLRTRAMAPGTQPRPLQNPFQVDWFMRLRA